ncbi:uncharacterized protein LOC143445835 [Clavelina lepadiformis]|uniref:uncharacterized protein LOC143445835 n=1 Tax=Clavelina lepadiformis TaxID=159417 RepID=UPI004043834D
MLLFMLLTMLLLWFSEWRPVIQKTILRKNVLTSGQSRSSSSNDQSILPKEIPSVTQPEIVDSDSGENFLENDTSVEDHHTNSTTSEDHVTPQPTDTDEGAVENKRSQSNSSSSNNESILSNQTLTIKIEYPVKTMLTIFAFCGFLTGILILLVGAMFVLEDPKQASLRAQMEYIENEVDLTLFRGAVRIQSIKGQAVSWNSTVKISDLKEVISAIRGGFEAEGFSIASVEFFQLSPVNVTVYSYLNHTVTSLNAPKSTTNNTLKANGWRMIVRATLECTGKPSKNAIGLRVGAVEIGMIQFMLDNYLANQRIVARMEAIEVSDEFKEGLKVALRAVPRLANIKVEENQDTIFIACHKKGADMPLSNILVRCPPDCHEAKVSEIIGTHSYHIQSSVCLAATHNHVIQLQNGGVVEYLESGTGFVFEGIPSNGVNSTSREEFSRQFIVKKPGSSWAIPDPTVTPTTTLKPLQEPTLILMEIAFMLLELDGQKVSFSMLTVRHVNNLVVEAITIKFKAALQAIGFDIVLIKVANLSPSLLNVASVKVKLHVYGGFMANAWAMFPYKPWKNADVDRLEEKVTEFLGRIHTVDFEIKLNLNFVSQLEITPSTTQAPITKYTSKCGCGDVFFIQINDSPEKTKILSIYKSLLNAFTFDQLELGLGLALDGTIITRVGQDLAKETLRRLEEELNLPERNEISLWRLLVDLESESSFLMQGIGKRKKLLIISSSYVFGADAKNIEIYLNRIKDRGVSIAYVGYEWDQKLLQAVYYPLKFASKPSSDFVFHVDNLNYFNRLAKFMGNVIRRYVCESPPTTCEDLHFAIPPPINMQYNFSVDGSRNSYTKGIPVGTGLKEYTSEAGSSYNGVDLPATQTFRKTEPDKDQAFYRRDRCGQQANQPSFPSGRIVGGSEALPHSWPWAISINYVKMQNGRYNYNFWKCGGSVIDKRWILTAAHCFANGNTLEKESKYQVAIGIHDQRDMNGLYGNIYKIDRIVHHPQYDDYRNKFDIALLYLDRDIQYRREVAPVCLPNADVIPATARECWVVGWGYTSNSGKFFFELQIARA